MVQWLKLHVADAQDPGLIPGHAGDVGLTLGSRRSPGEENGNLLKYFCLGNPMDRGSWQATVYGVTKSWTQQLNNKTIGN